LHFIAPDLYDAHVHHCNDSDDDDSDGEDDSASRPSPLDNHDGMVILNAASLHPTLWK
jgi:hypothetical protein